MFTTPHLSSRQDASTSSSPSRRLAMWQRRAALAVAAALLLAAAEARGASIEVCARGAARPRGARLPAPSCTPSGVEPRATYARPRRHRRQKEEAPLLPSFSEDEQAYQKRAWEGLIGALLRAPAALAPPPPPPLTPLLPLLLPPPHSRRGMRRVRHRAAHGRSHLQRRRARGPGRRRGGRVCTRQQKGRHVPTAARARAPAPRGRVGGGARGHPGGCRR